MRVGSVRVLRGKACKYEESIRWDGKTSAVGSQTLIGLKIQARAGRLSW